MKYLQRIFILQGWNIDEKWKFIWSKESKNHSPHLWQHYSRNGNHTIWCKTRINTKLATMYAYNKTNYIKIQNLELPVNHILIVKILQTMQNLSCIGRYLGISESIPLIEASKRTFGYKLNKDMKLGFILQ